MARDLADLERGQMAADTVFTSEVITALRVGLARIEGKLDAALTLRRDFETHKAAAEKERTETRDRLTKLESFNGFQTWIGGAIIGLLTIGFGATITYILTHVVVH